MIRLLIGHFIIGATAFVVFGNANLHDGSPIYIACALYLSMGLWASFCSKDRKGVLPISVGFVSVMHLVLWFTAHSDPHGNLWFILVMLAIFGSLLMLLGYFIGYLFNYEFSLKSRAGLKQETPETEE